MTAPADVNTQQAKALSKTCSPTLATILGLSFADRDMELIEHLKTLPDALLPQPSEYPTREKLVEVLGVEYRMADLVWTKVQRFVHKRRIKTDFSADVGAFAERSDVKALAEKCKKLKPGATCFIGDSHMDIRHFSCNASFPILVGSFLESLGVGRFVNAGIGGQTTKQGLDRFKTDVIAHKPVRVVISFGGNDFSNNVPTDSVCANFESMIQQCKAVGADVVMGLLLPMVPERLWWAGDSLNAPSLDRRLPLHNAMRDLAKKHAIGFIDLLQKFGPDQVCIDGVHINQTGQELVGVECLRQLIRG